MQDSLYLKLLENWANDNAPVFVVGPERSGTSLLFQQVSNHSAFCDFSEATVETFCFNSVVSTGSLIFVYRVCFNVFVLTWLV